MGKEIIFNKLELDVAKEVLNIGLAKAADSLSFFTKEKVLIRGMNITFTEFENSDLFHKQGDNITLLSTQLRGDVVGYCYLIFTEFEVNKLAEISLPESILDNKEQFEEMKNAILLEADNIITASVVTQFSNLLSKNMHGHVPFHFNGNHEKVKEYIRDQAKNEKYILQFNASLISDGNNINPEFLWCLDHSFVDAIKTFVANDINLKNLKVLLQKEGK